MERLAIQIDDRMTVTIESTDVRELVKNASFWSELPRSCPTCGMTVQFMFRNPQDNEYYGMQCTGSPKHETNFGIYKDSAKGLYYKREWHEAFGGQDADGNYTGGGATEPFKGFPANPVGMTLGDMVSGKQLNMIKAIARNLQIDADTECSAMMSIMADALSKNAASEFIKYLQACETGVYTAATKNAVPALVPQPSPAAPPPTAPSPAPQPVAVPTPVAAPVPAFVPPPPVPASVPAVFVPAPAPTPGPSPLQQAITAQQPAASDDDIPF